MYGIEKYEILVASNDITFIAHLVKIGQLLQKLKGDTQTMGGDS